jgi:ABC-type transporter Mla subunit MlaD
MTVRTRRTRRSDRPDHTRIFLRGTLTTLVLLALGYIAVTSYSGVPGKRYDRLAVEVPRVGSLIVHDLVRVRGERVGQVREISPGPDGAVRLELQLERGTAVPADSRVVLRANGLLGARYVEIVPGHSASTLASGALLRGGASSLTFGVTDALDTFDVATRGGLGELIGGLGQGLLATGEALNRALSDGAGAIVPARKLFAALADERPALDALIPALDRAAGTLDRNRIGFGRLLRPAAVALMPFARERGAVQNSLRQAPASLRAASTGLAAGRHLLDAVHALADDARPALSRAPGGLRATTALLREARAPVDRAERLVDAVAPTVPAALRLTAALRPLAQPLVAAFDDVRTVADRAAPYSCDIVNFAAVFRSMTGLGSIGEGPVGPAMQFRLQAAITPPEEALGTTKISGLVKRIGYPEPCRFLATPYPILSRPKLAGR